LVPQVRHDVVNQAREEQMSTEQVMNVVIILALLAGGLYVATFRGFWLAAVAIGGLASLFAMLASIIHFQILGALGFAFLVAVCVYGCVAIIENDRRPFR
jgi:hypothetical protein